MSQRTLSLPIHKLPNLTTEGNGIGGVIYLSKVFEFEFMLLVWSKSTDDGLYIGCCMMAAYNFALQGRLNVECAPEI
ncbi:MAG: hypothetical protein GY740_16005 [Gammaproteobacteria bacterium]|nr:hypothetical protein [Gammaproteobacteria bacterium]